MRHLLRLTLTLIAFAAAAPGQAQTDYPPINDAALALMTELRVFAGCPIGRAPKVGIWPLNGDDLPIEDDSAVAFYETVFAALNASKPDCVTFIDGASGGGAIRYFMLVGDGAEARTRVDDAFRDVEFILTLDIFDRGGRIRADLKLTNANAVTVAAPPAFDIPDDFIDTACGAGAIPLDRALRVSARRLIEKAPDLTALIDRNGTFANSDEAPGFTSYFSGRMIQALEDQAADNLSGRSVRRADEAAFGEAGVYAFSFRYWPCAGGSAAEISAELRASDGKTASWHGDVRLDRVPSFIDIFPPEPEPEREPVVGVEPAVEDGPGGVVDPGTETEPKRVVLPELDFDPPKVPRPAAVHNLTFSPLTANVGDVVSIVANVASGCTPFFLDLHESGQMQPLTRDIFAIEPRPEGGSQYRVDQTTPTGLMITPQDTKGVHFVGYVCTPGGAQPETATLKEIFAGLAKGDMRRTDETTAPVFLFERYVIR